LKPGLKSPTFDPSLYAEDSTLANNQPGLVQALQLLADGLGSLKTGALAIRQGLKSGDAAAPGVTEGLNQVVAGIGTGNEFDGSGNPLTVLASLNDGSGNPLTLRATVNALRKGLSSTDSPAVIEGLQQIFTAIGTGTEFAGTTPLTVAAGLAAIHGGLSSGDLNNPKIIEGLQKIYASIGNGSEFQGPVPLSLAASLAGVRAALSSGNANSPAILEGLQTIFAGIGAGNEFDPTTHTPLTVRASLNAIRAALGTSVNPGIIQGIQLVVTNMTALKQGMDGFDQAFVATVQSQLGGIPLALPLDPTQSAVMKGVLDAGIAQFKAGIDAMSAGLKSGDPNAPGVFEGLTQIYDGIGAGNEFNGATPLTIAASLVAMRAGLSSGDANNPKIIEGVQKIYAAIGTGAEFNGTTPLTIRAGLNAVRAGLSSGNANDPKIIEGLQQIYAAIGTGGEFNGTTPLSLRASLNAIRAGLSSGNVNDPKIIEGLQKMWAALGDGSEFNGTTPLTLQAGLVALQQGAATIAGGAQLVHAGIGDGTEFAQDGSPLSVEASLVAISTGLGELTSGVGQIVAGLGDVDATGKAVKSVTTRVSKFGNTIETPASLLYALDVSRDAVTTKFIVGVGQILDALGDPNVPSATILSGLKQLSDGLALAGGGSNDGADGAAQLAHILSRSVANADVVTALHQAGLARAEAFSGLGKKADHLRTVFIFRQGGVS
jgi:uncharacterized phage infection (PIP) family protein YhgE